MFAAIHRRLASLATWPVVSLLFVGFVACTQGFSWRHQKLGYTDTPDARFWYTPGEVRELFEEWGPARRNLYAWTEVTLDLAFPLIYGTLFAVLVARLFRADRCRRVAAVPLLGAATDLLENGTAAALAWTYDGRESPAVWAATAFTAVKTTCFIVSLFLLLAGGIAGLCARAEPGAACEGWAVFAAVGGGLLAAAALAYLHPPAVRALDASKVRAVEVRFDRRGEQPTPPGASTADPEAIAAVVAVLRSGERTGDHKCGSRGAITLRRANGTTAVLEFLPGHHDEWYELRYAAGIYRVPRAEFVAAMRRVGVEVPLEC